jgi:integrase
MDEERARLFLGATHGERLGTMWLVGLQTGMRPEEYQGLFLTDFDFARHTCHIQRALVRPTGGKWAGDAAHPEGRNLGVGPLA